MLLSLRGIVPLIRQRFSSSIAGRVDSCRPCRDHNHQQHSTSSGSFAHYYNTHRYGTQNHSHGIGKKHSRLRTLESSSRAMSKSSHTTHPTAFTPSSLSSSTTITAATLSRQTSPLLSQAYTHSSNSTSDPNPFPSSSSSSSTPPSALPPSYDSPPEHGLKLADLPKSWNFTDKLPADPAFPTPEASHATPRDKIGPRTVQGALFTWVRPQKAVDPKLLATSPAAIRDLGLDPDEVNTPLFREVVSGNRLLGWQDQLGSDQPTEAQAPQTSQKSYPWAQCYGGYQFGQWAGQLGDGRAISLFESTNPRTQARYEWQLKGSGLTPYSRFADGRAVLRASIREFIVSEALHALHIPTTRALALTHLPLVKARRESIEPCAVVLRFASSWLRIGTFDLLRMRGDRKLIRQLATYVAEDVFGGWENLPGRIDDPNNIEQCRFPKRGIPAHVTESAAVPEEIPSQDHQPTRESGEKVDDVAENRFARLYREIVRRNAQTTALWQAYGFMNGVLNTDNTSIYGASMDFGPFAFMDTFEPTYTPNHDDYTGRYSYRNQPTVIWWNLVRLGESLAELIGAGADVDKVSTPPLPSSPQSSSSSEEEIGDAVFARAEQCIVRAGIEYQTVFRIEYYHRMASRLGLTPTTQASASSSITSFSASSSPTPPPPSPSDQSLPSLPYHPDDPQLVADLLSIMTSCQLDFNLFFRRLTMLSIEKDLADEETSAKTAEKFFYHDADIQTVRTPANIQRIVSWLQRWCTRADSDDARRQASMRLVNPAFIPRSWILDEVIRRVEDDGDYDVLRRAIHMATHPFQDVWHGVDGYSGEDSTGGDLFTGDDARKEESRWISEASKPKRAMQCSCSS